MTRPRTQSVVDPKCVKRRRALRRRRAAGRDQAERSGRRVDEDEPARVRFRRTPGRSPRASRRAVRSDFPPKSSTRCAERGDARPAARSSARHHLVPLRDGENDDADTECDSERGEEPVSGPGAAGWCRRFADEREHEQESAACTRVRHSSTLARPGRDAPMCWRTRFCRSGRARTVKLTNCRRLKGDGGQERKRNRDSRGQSAGRSAQPVRAATRHDPGELPAKLVAMADPIRHG